MTNKPRRPVGRSTKYTPETVAEIVKAIREGCSQDDAALLAGVSRTTFYAWVSEKPEFSDAVEKAHADFKRANVAAIRAAGMKAKDGKLDGSWQANAWLLERKYPEEFAQKRQITVKLELVERLQKHGLSASDALEMFLGALEEQKVNAE